MVNPIFEKWATGHSGCDGGDIGFVERPSIWFCGIEWGGGKPDDQDEHAYESKLLETLQLDVSAPAIGYVNDNGEPNWTENLAYIFNWQAMKLLTAISGGQFSDYKKFAESEQPFVKGRKGYYKMNLYPLAFKNTSHHLWQGGVAKVTGFENKQDYKDWVRRCRFPVMKTWVELYVPALIVCTGITYSDEFKHAFVDDGKEFKRKAIDGKDLYWWINKNGTVIVNIPFMVNRNGLTRNVLIQKFGEWIRALISSANSDRKRQVTDQ